MTLIEIVSAYLTANGYGGLYNEGECACEKADLAPCGQIGMDCTPGYRAPCDCGDHDWHIQEKKA